MYTSDEVVCKDGDSFSVKKNICVSANRTASGIPYCVWNYLSTPNDGNRFSLVDDDTREIVSKGMLAAINGRG